MSNEDSDENEAVGYAETFAMLFAVLIFHVLLGILFLAGMIGGSFGGVFVAKNIVGDDHEAIIFFFGVTGMFVGLISALVLWKTVEGIGGILYRVFRG